MHENEVNMINYRPSIRSRGRRLMAAAVAVALACTGLVACNNSSGNQGGTRNGITTITLSGPNQWTDSGSSFGPAWDRLIAAFEKQEPKIKIKTNVLPLKTFNSTLSTQLSAGTAPALVFNQASYQPFMVTPLDSYLKKPNPYVPGNKHWIDLFNPKYFGYHQANAVDAQGHLNWIPFNLVGVAVFYNKDAFSKVGVQPPKNFADMIRTCSKLKSAGYTPFAGENSDISVSWTFGVIFNQLLAKYRSKLNVYDAAGKPGTSPQTTSKDWAKALATGEITTKTPEVAESLKLTKQFYDSCVTKNWSGIAGNSGALVGIQQFSTGKAAMTWGTDFASSAIPDVSFHYASVPFPTVTQESTPLSQNFPAQFGVSPGGTSYMIPSTTKGDQLAAAIKFLQFVSAPDHIKPWLDATGAVSALRNVKPSPAAAGFTSGAWGTPMTMGLSPVANAPGTTSVSLFDGYLLGAKSLTQEQSYLQDMWNKGLAYTVKTNKWTNESWAKGIG